MLRLRQLQERRDAMKAWKKWCVFSSMFLQFALGVIGILWWCWPQASLAVTISEFLGTELGRWLILVVASYLVIVAIFSLGWMLMQPTTQKAMTIHRDHTSKIQVDQKAVENQLRLTLGKYDLINVKVRVKLLTNHQRADVFVQGDLAKNADLSVLETKISQAVAKDLKEMLRIDLSRLNVSLQPYHYGQKVTII